MQNIIKNKKGMSVIEILVVIAVLGIIFFVVIPQFSKTRENQVLKNAVSDVLSSLDKARSQTLASVDLSSYGVRFESNKVIIFKGTSFNPNDVSNETINITSPAVISSGTLTIPVNIFFNRLSGTPSNTGTVTMLTKTIRIWATGIVSVN